MIGLLDIYGKYVRDKIPSKLAIFNTKSVMASTTLGHLLHGGPPERPHYESGIANSLRTWVDKGDDVVIVGGGWGVTAALAAEKVGPTGSVHVFEGSKEHVKHVRETAELNEVADCVTVTHAIVGSRISLRGAAGSPELISPADLPACDVLELDCEGSEIGILEGISITPRVVIVESHGHLDASSAKVRALIDSNGYEIVAESIADRELMETCLENDVRVLTGVQGDK